MKTKLELVKPPKLIPAFDISDLYKLYAEFHTAFGLGKTQSTQELYTKLVEEEHEEWLEEYFGYDSREFDELKELTDLLYVTLGLGYSYNYNFSVIKQCNIPEYYDYSITDFVEQIAVGNREASVLNDLIYSIFGYANSMNWNLSEAFARVHVSNMSKLGPDGKPVYREDGKVMKSDTYTPAFLEDLTNGH